MKDYSFMYEEKVFTYSDMIWTIMLMLGLFAGIEIFRFLIKLFNRYKIVKPIYVSKKDYDVTTKSNKVLHSVFANNNENFYAYNDIVCFIENKYTNTPLKEVKPNRAFRIISSKISNDVLTLECEYEPDIKISY